MLLQQVINGLAQGSVYALIAIGYTMVYGIIGLINFAHGDVYMVGAFLGFYAVNILHLPFFPALFIAMVGSALLGVIIEKIAYKPLRNAPKINLLVMAIGVSILLENGARDNHIFGPDFKAYPAIIKEIRYAITSKASITNLQIILFVVSIILVLILQYIVFWTKTGKAMRATSYDKDAALLMGININNIISVTFAIGSALAGAAGVLVGLVYTTINPYMGIMPGLKAFVAAVLGGIGVLPGAMIGGLLLGLVETLTKAYISTSLYDTVVFGLLILVLLVKPTGLLGKKTNVKV